MNIEMRERHATTQRGVALPVMLIMLAVMLIGSLYLIRSSTSSTLAATNLAYDSSLSRAADGGLMKGFAWLQAQVNASNKSVFNADGDSSNGYNAHFDTTLLVGEQAFWANQVATYTDANLNTITYTIYRMCDGPGTPTSVNCMATAANTSTNNNSVALGASLSVDSPQLNGSRQIHYIITAKITGPRGGNVVNQMVVMIGA